LEKIKNQELKLQEHVRYIETQHEERKKMYHSANTAITDSGYFSKEIVIYYQYNVLPAAEKLRALKYPWMEMEYDFARDRSALYQSPKSIEMFETKGNRGEEILVWEFPKNGSF
jgi:hypothetical protein